MNMQNQSSSIKEKLKQNYLVREAYLRNVKPIVNYFNYQKWKSHYAQNIIFIAGLPRSGSTWIANIFASLDGFEKYDLDNWKTGLMKSWDDFQTTDIFPGSFEKYKNKLAVIKGHTWGEERNLRVLRDSKLKYLITMRDPRDNIISCYYYIKNHPQHWDHIKSLNLTLENYITFKLKSGEYNKQNLNWIRSWLNNYDKSRSHMIKYEDMLIDPMENLRIAFSFMGFKINDAIINGIIEKNKFEKITGRSRGEEDKRSFNRKATSGEWESVFTREQKELFAVLGEDIINRLNYKPTL